MPFIVIPLPFVVTSPENVADKSAARIRALFPAGCNFIALPDSLEAIIKSFGDS